MLNRLVVSFCVVETWSSVLTDTASIPAFVLLKLALPSVVLAGISVVHLTSVRHKTCVVAGVWVEVRQAGFLPDAVCKCFLRPEPKSPLLLD